MRLLGLIAAVALGLGGGSIALAQHGEHHGGDGGGMMTMSCCDDDAAMSECPGHNDDGTCDMEECCGEMMEDMDGMMGGSHGGGMGGMRDMGDMMRDRHGDADAMDGKMCDAKKMKCCKKQRRNGAMMEASEQPMLY